MSDDRKIPEGRVGRFVRLAGLGARTSASLLFSKTGESAAERAAEVLGTLRGVAAKVGQMASYVDGVVPEAQREAYEAALRKLRDQAPTSSSAEIRALVERELGASIAELFQNWEDEPIASASIGQVHRARLSDGRVVAVKVQHAGIAKAVESDLENAGMLESLVGTFVGKGVNSRGVLNEIKARFREELDYRLEARRQTEFAQIFRGDPQIFVPAVVPERSSTRVLTSEFVAGTSLDEAATLGEAERRAYAEALWRFVFKGNLVGGMFNADPHPGNYLFQPEGRIAFLDFGCVQPIHGGRLGPARALHRAAVARDEQAFAQQVRVIMETRGGLYEDLAIAYSRRCFEPLFSSPFRVTREFVRKLVLEIGEMKQVIFKKGGNFVPLPEGMVFMNRLQFGFYSVLARLDVEVDYAAVERA
ncbi:MAG TPA: AarF/ABC1/UbiB kinase family protein, partial [Polyangiaceae bacterium]|nr:AarF/ABC1/UbiB kinase family protein [Polyangiaceae bacterium]